MNFFVAVTDYDWFLLHASKPSLEEVNFWRPSSTAPFKALRTGEMLLFKLHAPCRRNPAVLIAESSANFAITRRNGR
jgi:putative restriction endonuclease